MILSYIPETLLHSIHHSLVMSLLVIYNRLLDTLRQVNAMNGIEPRQSITIGNHIDKVMTLRVQQVTEIKQELIPGDIIKPVDSL